MIYKIFSVFEAIDIFNVLGIFRQMNPKTIMTICILTVCNFCFSNHVLAPSSELGEVLIRMEKGNKRIRLSSSDIIVFEDGAIPVSIREDLAHLLRLIDKLFSATSLNVLNQKVIVLLKEQHKKCTELLNDPDLTKTDKERIQRILNEWLILRNWFFFFLTSQDYRSPTHRTDNTVFQAGLIQISKYVSYLRSETNTPNFGEQYDRNTVLINTQSKESFADLASKYIVMVQGKKSITFSGPIEEFADFIATNEKNLCVIEISMPNSLETVVKQIELLTQRNPIFEGAIYLRFSGYIPERIKQNLSTLINNKISIEVLLEENYDPFHCDDQSFRKITFIHNHRDPLRYQLLQDAASMGYRPYLTDIAKYYYAADKLETILNTDYKTEDDIISRNLKSSFVSNVADKNELRRDYTVMLDTVLHLKNKLKDLKPFDELDIAIQEKLYQEALQVENNLKSILSETDVVVKTVAEVFHTSYYRIRSLLIYSSMLEVNARRLIVNDIEEKNSNVEGGLSLQTNSGMSAARTVITTLADHVDSVVTTDHYWETDFLIENVFGHNPHYKDSKMKIENRLTKLPFNLTEEEIESTVNQILVANAGQKGGQMLCLDKSIAPFFYTKTFNLSYLCHLLDVESYRIENPIYLVVDNTLDFTSINSTTLFPNGLPENIYLIFTPSMAKLHQLGMDIVTGGVINIHYHPNNENNAQSLYSEFKTKISNENTGQNLYQSTLLDNVFYQRYENKTMKNYLDYMVRKRQRNTKELISTLQTNLAEYLISDIEIKGMYHYQHPETEENAFTIKDSKGKEHKVRFSFHYDPKSCIHAFFKIEEPETDDYVAGPVFEEMKKRIFKRATAEGIHLADGTSWGFHITRLGSYMHTMRLATGLEHNKTLSKLGNIISSVIKELLLYPMDFLNAVEVEPMTPSLVKKHWETVLSLDSEIPHVNPTSIDHYFKEEPGKWKYSFIIKAGEKIAGMVLAYEKYVNEEKVVYISKASVAKEFRNRGFFKRMNLHLKDLARQEGISKVMLETSASQKNEFVVTAYEKCGFEVCDTIIEMLPNGWPLIKVLMELPTDRSDLAVIEHFNPVTPEVYERLHKISC